MGKVFITDEINPSYTAKVNVNRALDAMGFNYAYARITAAASTANISTAATWLHSVIINQPGTATTTFGLWSFSASAEVSAAITAGNICSLIIPAPNVGIGDSGSCSGGDSFPKTILLDCYAASGVVYTNTGAVTNVTVTYSLA